jgi:hypothetical protein
MAIMFRLVAAVFALGLALCQPVIADGMRYSRQRYYYPERHYLPPERHVIEVVQPPYSGRFIINGRRFTAKSTACVDWAAGERIKLVAGDWDGYCVDAVFYNVWRRSTCEMWCN